MQDWSNDGTEALRLRLVRSTKFERVEEAEEDGGEDEGDARWSDFAPTFVYPIFGEEETIYGYKDLAIDLHFASGSLRQYLSVKYAARLPSSSKTQPDDVEKILYEFIPPDYTKSLPDFEAQVAKDETSFVPFGDKIAAYKVLEKDEAAAANGGKSKGKGKAAAKPGVKAPPRSFEEVTEAEAADLETSYEVYRSTWDTPGFKEYHRRMQVFVLFYIEGAQYIDEEDTRWEFLTLYEKAKMEDGSYTYHFVGYTSFYSFYCYPDSKRLRLAQFVILPPYQGQSHGSALYTTAYKSILKRPEISELTVEDPSEVFEDMRDKNDLHTLLATGDFGDLKAPLDREWTEKKRKELKLADRQYYRLLEMLLLLYLPPDAPELLTAFRLTVKRRLFNFNRELLVQLDDKERKEKLEETWASVRDDYERLVTAFRA